MGHKKMGNLSTAQKDALAACAADMGIAAKVLFAERFSREFDPIHQQIFAKLENSTSRHIAIAAPRGIGKTSINNLLMPAMAILFHQADYIVPVSCSATAASQQSENLKEELATNPLIQQLFGSLKTKIFNKEQWVANVAGKEICVMPRGAGQQVRGLNFRGKRPNLIIVDDLEDPENMDSEEQRAKKLEWFYGSLLSCVDRGADDWKIVVLGTVLHQDSLLVRLLDDPHWDSITLEICDDAFVSNAPNFMSDEEIKALYEMFESIGKVDTFYREYRNMPVAQGKDAAFSRDAFKYYKEADIATQRGIESMLILDPAKTVKLSSAESGFAVWGVSFRDNRFYLRHAKGEKMHPEELYDEVARLCMVYNVRVIGIEVTSLHEFIIHPLKNALSLRGINVEIVELHARGGGTNEKGKVSRVKQLIPYYRDGVVYHEEHLKNGAYESQLMSFPRPKRWDIMDAASYLPEVLEQGERYLSSYANAFGHEETAETIEAEYAELDDFYEDAFEAYAPTISSIN